MAMTKHNLLLADDDLDDCIFFREALEELPLVSTLTTVNDGVQLMHLLHTKQDYLPDILFLDLNMPRKTGFECLSEIKFNNRLKRLPVIILSTSFDQTVVNLLYDNGAHYYIRKPAEFSKLKQIIHEAISLTTTFVKKRPSEEKFILNSD